MKTRKILPTTVKPVSAGVAAICLAMSAGAQAALEEIVVTAQKRTENMQEVPVSVSAISGSEMESLRFRDSTDITSQIPNLQATTTAGSGFPIFALRGVAMSDFSFNQASPVASYIDEVYKGNPALQGVQIFDLERIEVLRGPQGTLYGKNSTGGAVNFITRKPSYDELSGNIAVGFGDYSHKEVSGAIETPIVEDVLAVRLAATWTEADGWFENVNAGVDDGNAVDQYGVRLTVAWQPTDTVEAVLRYTHTDQDAVNYGIQPFNISEAGVGGGVYSLYNELGVTDKQDYKRDNLDYFEFESDQDEHYELSNDAVALTVNWDLSDSYTLTSITSWDDGEITNPEDSDGSPLVVLRPYYYGEAEQYTQDLRIASALDSNFNYIAGVYWSKEDVENATNIGFYQDLDMNADGNLDYLDCVDVVSTAFADGPVTESGTAVEGILNEFGLSLANFAPASCQFDNEFKQERTSYAGYFDGSYALGESWTARFGIRYTEDTTELSDFSARILASDGTPILNTIPGNSEDPFATTVDDDFTDREWTGKIGVDYLSNDGLLLYVSASHGYRSGAYNAQAFLDPAELTSVEPEELDSFEVGMKHEMLDGRLRFNAAAFFYQYDNQQFLNVDSATLAQTLVNIEESEILGMEAEVVAAVLPNLTVRAGLGLIDSEVQEGTLNGVDLEGNELLLAPEMNFNLMINWDVMQGDWGSFAAQASTTYVDDQYFDVFNTDRISEDGYWVSDARLQLTSSREDWQLALWIKNLADEEYRTSAIDLSDFGYDYAHIGAPRTYGAELRYNF
jgi:iron complex outermembrane recepter protein